MADVARPRLPKRIALVALGETHALSSLMANDFEDALGAYSEIGGTRPPAVQHSLEGNPAIDAVVIIFAACDARLAEDLLANLESKCLIYALASDDTEDAKDAIRALDALKDACSKHGLSWRGGLAVPCGMRRTWPSPAWEARGGLCLRRRMTSSSPSGAAIMPAFRS